MLNDLVPAQRPNAVIDARDEWTGAAETLRTSRPQIRVLYMPCDMDDAVVPHGVLAEVRAFL